MVDFQGQLKLAPVVYALCQLRFPSILKMSDHVPDIQDRLRVDYEVFEEEQIAGIRISGGDSPFVRSEIRWRFERRDRHAGYILSNAALVYHTTAYTDFDAFVPEVVRGFEAVAASVTIPRLERIGLRYIDLVEDLNGVPADRFLHPQLRGLGSELAVARENLTQYIYAGATAVGNVVLRVTRARHSLELPPDLLPLTLKAARDPRPDQPSVFLDTDHHVERNEPPILGSDLSDLLRALKAPISQIFRLAITQEAVRAWQ